MLALLAVAGVFLRQLISNATVPVPSTDAEAALGVNAYAFPRFSELRIPGSVSDAITAWPFAGYSYLTSATGRHESLVGSTREFLLVLAVLTAALTVAVCRRLFLGWIGTALAVALAGIPGAVALARIISAPAAVAAFWLALAALSAVIVADRQGRRAAERRDGVLARPGWRNWILIALTVAASAIAVLTAGVSVLILLGLVFGFVSTRRLDDNWNLGLRGLAILSLCAALVGASWITVWGPSVNGGVVGSVEAAGAAVALGGLVLAAACSPVAWLRPLALGAVPILLAAAWPGPAQATAMLLGITVLAMLAAGLLDTLLRHGQSNLVRPRRFPAASVLAAATLLVAVIVGAFVLPSPAPAAATAIPSAAVAAWIDTQLPPDAVVEVDPLSRAQLVRDGLDPARLSTADQSGDQGNYLLVPLDTRTELPLLASFGAGADALGLRLAVADPTAFAQAQVADEAARSRFGTALARNPQLTLGAPAAAALRSGDVDSRLMVSLATASSSVRLAIAEFTGTAGDLEQGNVYRAVTLTDITVLEPAAGANGTSSAALRWLAQFFQRQLSPYRPMTVLDTDDALTVVYAAPSPLGLLP